MQCIGNNCFDRFIVYVTKWIGTSMSLFVHTLFFIGMFFLKFVGVSIDDILLILTTVVSLEAIYLAIFIQMTVNRHTQDIAEVVEDIQDIQEDVQGIQEGVHDIHENVQEIGDDVDEISQDVEEISQDVEEISQDIEEIQEDDEEKYDRFNTKSTLLHMESTLQKLMKDIELLKDKEDF